MQNKLKPWEIALVLALALSLLLGPVPGAATCNAWWGVIYPDLAAPATDSAAVFSAAAPGGVTVRWQLWDWLIKTLRT